MFVIICAGYFAIVSELAASPTRPSLACFIIDPYTSRDCLQLHFAAADVDSAKSPHSAYDFNFDCSFAFSFFARSRPAPARICHQALWGHGKSFV